MVSGHRVFSSAQRQGVVLRSAGRGAEGGLGKRPVALARNRVLRGGRRSRPRGWGGPRSEVVVGARYRIGRDSRAGGGGCPGRATCEEMQRLPERPTTDPQVPLGRRRRVPRGDGGGSGRGNSTFTPCSPPWGSCHLSRVLGPNHVPTADCPFSHARRRGAREPVVTRVLLPARGYLRGWRTPRAGGPALLFSRCRPPPSPSA